MLGILQKELLSSIDEIHKFESSEKYSGDFKAAVVELRSALIKVQGEFFANMLKNNYSASQMDTMKPFTDSMNTAINTCDTVALMQSLMSTYDYKILASFLIMNGKISSIEAVLNAMKE